MTALTPPPLMIGCGIFAKEIITLAHKNGWRLETSFLDSALHNNLDRLSKGLTGSLAKRRDRHPIVFYGACHPLMDRYLAEAHTIRTPGQNCIEMLLGRERFDRELEQGAYFLVEDWALNWTHVMGTMFGANPEIAAELFGTDRSYVLAIRTPCSGDFLAQAEEAARMVKLPLVWTDVSLDHLEAVLAETLAHAP